MRNIGRKRDSLGTKLISHYILDQIVFPILSNSFTPFSRSESHFSQLMKKCLVPMGFGVYEDR
jgi:hypothetical protein